MLIQDKLSTISKTVPNLAMYKVDNKGAFETLLKFEY